MYHHWTRSRCQHRGHALCDLYLVPHIGIVHSLRSLLHSTYATVYSDHLPNPGTVLAGQDVCQEVWCHLEGTSSLCGLCHSKRAMWWHKRVCWWWGWFPEHSERSHCCWEGVVPNVSMLHLYTYICHTHRALALRVSSKGGRGGGSRGSSPPPPPKIISY